MIRWLPLCAVLFVLPLPGLADSPIETVTKAEVIIRLKVQPAPAPKPALRYQLLPELWEMNPGNPVLGFLKCFSEQRHFFGGKEALADREKWDKMPLKDLPREKLRGYGGVALRQADYAARLDTPDWQILVKLKSDGIELLLPEVQQMRELTWALKTRLRGEIADHRYDKALVTAKTMLALARLMSEHPTLIASLVGLALAHITLEPLHEMLQEPGCPNLYWALSDLPSPFIDIRKGLQGERVILMKEFDMLDEQAPMTEAQVQKVVDRFQVLQNLMTFNPDGQKLKPELRDWFAEQAKDQAYVAAARKRLIEYGTAEDLVKQFPALQVVFLNERRLFEEQRDDRLKGMLLPYWQVDSLMADRKVKEDSPLARMVPVAAGAKVRQAQARLERRFALLRHVEALRLHAAENDGKLPEKLADIKLPLPVDPFTGKAFPYKLEGSTAILRGTPPAGMEKSPVYNLSYEVTIRK